jgi:PAS domain S-box-containing protein
MNSEHPLLGLINNAALLLALGVLYDTFSLRLKRNTGLIEIPVGLILGGLGIAVMLSPWQFEAGIVFDTRTILLSVTGLFFGAIPTAIAVAMTALLRIYQGGGGMYMGVATIVTSASIGVAWRAVREYRKRQTMGWLELYLFGLAVHVNMLFWTILLPRDSVLKVLEQISAPVMLIYPVGTVLLGMLLVHQLARRKTEEALRHERNLMQSVMQTSPVGITVVDKKGQITFFNAFARKLFGLTEESADRSYNSAAWHITDYEGNSFPEEQLPFNLVKSTGQAVFGVRHAVERPDGHRILLSINAAPLLDKSGRFDGMVAVAEDVTERVKAEAVRERIEDQLRQAQKMEAVGRLAGGVAHDFNNMLHVILGYADLGRSRLDPQEPLYQELLEIEKAARRSAELTQQLLAFSRKQIIEPKILSLNEAVENQKKMLERLIGEDIKVDFMPGEDLWNIQIDPSQIDQILTNLAVNARDAIGGVGSVTIETANTTLEEKYKFKDVNVTPGDYVMLAFTDSGSGMDEDTLEQIFEPFFTTKPKGQGVGLGLATVYGIVKQNNGFIHVYSEKGMGTTLKIYFPRVRGDALPLQEKPHEPFTSKAETILVVEDEEQVLDLVKAILEQYDYTVLTSRTPMEACQLVETYEGDIALLLTDVVMPEMNGQRLGARIKKLKPNAKVLFMSGYTANVIAHRGVLEDGVNFIAKPFTAQALARKVREVLESAN